MAIAAICVRCGKPKKEPLRQCKTCGYRPETEYEKARALIFSLSRTLGGTQVGRDAEALRALSAQTRAGKFYEFDPNEESRVVEALLVHEREQAHRRSRSGRIVWIILLLAFGVIGLGTWLYFRAG